MEVDVGHGVLQIHLFTFYPLVFFFVFFGVGGIYIYTTIYLDKSPFLPEY